MRINRFFLSIISLVVLTFACTIYDDAFPTSTAHDLPRFNDDGVLQFQVEQGFSSEGGKGPPQGCWPSDYYDDGNGYLKFDSSPKDGSYILTGHCSWTSPSDKNPQVTWNNVGDLTGSFDQETGTIIFHLETTAEYPYSIIVKVVFDGGGFFTSETHAEGAAKFTSTCTSLGDENHCGTPPGSQEATRKSWNISGTVPWTMDFSLAPDR